MIGKRIDAKDLRCKDRQPLQTIIPLDTPFVVYIDPTNRCNFNCSFCPTSDKELLSKVNRPSSYMNFDLFKKAIDDISEFPSQLKLLSLYKDGEPLLNKNFVQMANYAKEKNISERIWTKTNGSRLAPVLNRQLIDSGLDLISISIEATSAEGYKRIANVNIDYQELISNIADLYQRRKNTRIYIKIANTNLTPKEKSQFYQDFEPYCDHIAIENLMGWSNSELKDFTPGIDSDTYDGLPFTQKEVCAYPFYVLAINSDGSVSVCGNDWSHGTVVGDLKNDSLQDIWRGEAMHQLRMRHLTLQRKKIDACKNCYYLQIVPDNIDEHRLGIMESISNNSHPSNKMSI